MQEITMSFHAGIEKGGDILTYGLEVTTTRKYHINKF